MKQTKKEDLNILRIAIVVILILEEGLPSLVQCTCLSKIVLYVFLFNPYIQRIF